MEYYYLENGETRGPFTRETLIELYQSNVITAETLISSPDDTDWKPLKNKLEISSPEIARPAITTPNGLSIWQCYKRCFKYYATFSGRATRKEYWSFNLITSCFFIIILCAMGFYESAIGDSESIADIVIGLSIGGCGCIFACISVIPSLAVTWRRLHDVGFSGWFFFLNLIPYVGGLILIMAYLFDSKRGDNVYGPSCKYPQQKNGRKEASL